MCFKIDQLMFECLTLIEALCSSIVPYTLFANVHGISELLGYSIKIKITYAHGSNNRRVSIRFCLFAYTTRVPCFP